MAYIIYGGILGIVIWSMFCYFWHIHNSGSYLSKIKNYLNDSYRSMIVTSLVVILSSGMLLSSSGSGTLLIAVSIITLLEVIRNLAFIIYLKAKGKKLSSGSSNPFMFVAYFTLAAFSTGILFIGLSYTSSMLRLVIVILPLIGIIMLFYYLFRRSPSCGNGLRKTS